MSDENKLSWTGRLPLISKRSIYLNINALKSGEYVVKIIHKNKVIEEFTFNKK